MESYSREYLRDLPNSRKRAMLEDIINAFLPQLLTAATMGRAGYLFEYNWVDPNPRTPSKPIVEFGGETFPVPSIAARGILTDEDVVEACKLKFPGCQVSFKGDWHIIKYPTPEKTVFKMGVYISWA